MLTLTNRIDMRPGAVPLVIHLGQYDSDFTLVFELYSSAGNFTVESGTAAMIRGTKTDGNAYDADATINISAKTVTVAGSEQMTAAKGRNVYELVLTKSGKVLSTANFIIDVERAAMDADTIASESVLKELNAIIAGAATATEAAADAATAADRAEDAADSVSSASAQIATNTADIADLKADLENLEPITEDVKVALLNCFEHVAWIDEHGQDYYDALEAALYPETGLVSISAVFTQGSAVIYPSTPINDLKAYLVVNGYYNDGTSKIITDYSLSGALEVGTSTITVTKEGKTDTFDVVVSSSYWDYEWYASSRTLPEGMTSDEYDFTTESGAMFVKTPNLDFDFIGNCICEIEMKAHVESSSGTIEYGGSNPQIVIKNAVVSSNQFRGAKIIFNFKSSGVSNLVGIGINGTNSNIQGIIANDYHVYNLRAENNVYSLSVDGETKQVTQNNNTSQYFSFTGLAASLKPDGGFYGAFIKSIKFKRL